MAILGYNFDIISIVIGAVVMFIACGVGEYIYRWRQKKVVKHSFMQLRRELKEGYAGLTRASESFKKLYDILDEVENAKD